MSDEAESPPKKLTFKAAEFESVNAAEGTEAPAGDEPLELLKGIREHEKANNSIYDQTPAYVPKKSRRNRDYVFGLVAINLLLGVLLFPTPLFLFAAVVFFSAGWTWAMLFVIDDYDY